MVLNCALVKDREEGEGEGREGGRDADVAVTMTGSRIHEFACCPKSYGGARACVVASSDFAATNCLVGA